MVMLFMNVPVAVKKTILGLLPALQQPTVSPLVNDGFVAINTVVSIEKVNDVIKNVLQAGAQGVIQVPVTKLIRSW
jgi:ATP phosphoribosyltransferase